MKLRPFIKTHIKALLNNFDFKKGPFDSYLREYYKNNKTLGPSERSIISQTSFEIIRNDLLLSYFSKDTDRKCDLLQNITEYQNDEKIPLNIRCSCPELLFKHVSDQYGSEQTYKYFLALNEKAPLTIRVNPQKITRENLIKNMKELYFKKTYTSPYGLIVSKDNNINLIDTKEFQQGLFEIQDEASQICALRVKCQPNQKVLDYCAGSGGKTLAFAHQMQGKGMIEINDTRQDALQKAKLRFKRAGINNYMLFTKKYKFDWILLDVPCTGLGTLRRNPDIKYKFSLEKLEKTIEQQRNIFDQAIKYLKFDGVLVYTTCSFLKDENQDQVQYFCKKYNLKIVDETYFQSLPEKGGMDSFFSISLQKN